jgi:hypothetical protein
MLMSAVTWGMLSRMSNVQLYDVTHLQETQMSACERRGQSKNMKSLPLQNKKKKTCFEIQRSETPIKFGRIF